MSLDRTRGGRTLAVVLTACALLAPAAARSGDAPEGRRVSVEITCPEGGTLYAYLVDEARFGRPNVGLQTRVVKVAGKSVVRIAFSNVPPGTYAVRCFLDTNHNKKLDRGLFGPSEPWGMSFRSGRPERWPSWDSVKFTVAGEDKTLRVALRG